MRGRGARAATGLLAGRGIKRSVKGDLDGGAWWWSPLITERKSGIGIWRCQFPGHYYRYITCTSCRNFEAALGHGGAKP